MPVLRDGHGVSLFRKELLKLSLEGDTVSFVEAKVDHEDLWGRTSRCGGVSKLVPWGMGILGETEVGSRKTGEEEQKAVGLIAGVERDSFRAP